MWLTRWSLGRARSSGRVVQVQALNQGWPSQQTKHQNDVLGLLGHVVVSSPTLCSMHSQVEPFAGYVHQPRGLSDPIVLYRGCHAVCSAEASLCHVTCSSPGNRVATRKRLGIDFAIQIFREFSLEPNQGWSGRDGCSRPGSRISSGRVLVNMNFRRMEHVREDKTSSLQLSTNVHTLAHPSSHCATPYETIWIRNVHRIQSSIDNQA